MPFNQFIHKEIHPGVINLFPTRSSLVRTRTNQEHSGVCEVERANDQINAGMRVRL